MTRLALVLDLESGKTRALPVRPEFIDDTVRGRVPCRPFGITWHRDELFIVNNRQLLVFDKQFEYVRTLSIPLQVNTHQLAHHASRIWAVSPWTNSLIGVCASSGADPVELDLIEHRLRPYVPRDASEGDDRAHFNSLLWSGDHLLVAAHNFRCPSFISRYDARTLRLDAVWNNAGSAIHGLAVDAEETLWISTNTREIRSSLGYRVPLGRQGYARGLAVTDKHLVVAISQFLARHERQTGDSWIQVIDRRRSVLIDEIHLSDTGSINDLRLLDEYDHAHGLEPFL